MLRKLLSVVIATLLLTTSLSAQSYRMFTTENGLPSTSITYIYQDSFGFVWIATENGLVRYDGARFVTYSHRENDPSSLAHDFVTSLTEDKKGNLFVSTYMGVQVYNYDTNTFSANVCWDDGSPFGDNANQVFCSSEGNMYSVGYSINRLSFDGHTLTAHKLPMPSGVKNFIKMIKKNKFVSLVEVSVPFDPYHIPQETLHKNETRHQRMLMGQCIKYVILHRRKSNQTTI